MLAVFILALVPSRAEEKPPTPGDPLPKLDQTGVVVPWEDFKKILEEIRRVDPVVPPLPPPVDFAFSECRAVAVVTGDQEQVSVRLELSLQVLNPEKWVEVPVIAEGAALARFEIDDRPANVYRKGGQLQIALRGEGRHDLVLEYLAPVQSGRGTRSVSFLFPRAPVIALDLRIPQPRLDVNLAGAVVRSIDRTATETRVRAAFQQAANASVTWFKQAELDEKETKVFGELRTLLSIGEGMVQGTATAVYTIHGQGADTFRIDLPAEVNVLDVSAQGVREWKIGDGDGEAPVRVLAVYLNHRAKGTYAIQISFEVDLGDASAETAVPSFVLRDVLRDRGFIAVAAATNVEISPIGDLTNATPIDPAELPADLIARAAQPILYGFKYLRHPVEIGLKITRHEDLAVKRTIVESARLFTYLSPEGKLITSARYTVKNNRKQYLEVTLPEAAEGWGVYLEDRPVKAAVDHKGTILIPLKKTAGNGTGDLMPFEVELVYFQGRPSGTWGRRQFTGPALDVDAMEVQWHLFLPRDRRYFGFDGNLHPDEELNRIIYVGTAAYNMRARDDLARLRSVDVGGKVMITDGLRNIVLDGVVRQLAGSDDEPSEELKNNLRALGYIDVDAAKNGQGIASNLETGKIGRLEHELKELTRKGERADAPAESKSMRARGPAVSWSTSQAVGYEQAAGGLVGHAGRARGLLPVRFGIPVDGLRLSFTGRILTAAEAPAITMRVWPLGWVLSGSVVFLLSLGLMVAILGARIGFVKPAAGAETPGRLTQTLMAAAGMFFLFVLNPENRGAFWLGMAMGFAGFFIARFLSERRSVAVVVALIGALTVPAGVGAIGITPVLANSPPSETAGSAATAPPDLPDLQGTEITLSWQDFKSMVEKTYRPPVIEPPPPAEAFLRSGEYTARLEPGLLTLDGTLVLEVLKDGWIRLPLQTQGTVLNFEGNGAVLNRSGGQLEILAKGPATFTLRASLAFPAGSHPGENHLRIAMPKAASNLIHLTADPSFQDVEVESGLVYRSAGGRIYVALHDGILGMKYTLPFRGTEEQIGEEVKLEPRVQLQAYQLLRLGDGVLSGVLVHDYNVRVAKVSHFDIDLPDNIVIFDSVAPGLESWKILQRDGQRYLRLKLLAPAGGSVRGIVHFEGTYDPDEGRVAVPRFPPLGVERESGFVAVSAEGAELELDLTGKLLPADISELPPDVAAIDRNLISAYKYSGEPDRAAVRITEHEDAPVLTAIIESLNATATVLENGTETTWIDLAVKNNRKQFLSFRVPGEEVEIWSLMLNGQPAKPKRTGNNILVPLPRGDGEVVSRISLVLLRRGPEIHPFGRIDPYLPSFDVPVSEALWTVYLPAGMRYAPRENGFRPVVVTAPPVVWGRGSWAVGKLSRDQKMLKGSVPRKEAAEDYGDAVSESMARAQADQEARIAGQLKRKTPVRRGTLPVRIAIPRGILQLPKVTMARMLIVGDEDNTFTIRVYPGWVTGVLRVLQRFLIVGSAILIGFRSGGFLSRGVLVGALAAGLLGMLPFGGIASLAALVLWFFLALITWASIMLYQRMQTTAQSPV